MDVHVLDIRQVADDARHDDIALVLHRARLAAIPYTEIPAPLVGAERHEQKQRALVNQVAGDFRELGVIADHHADRAAIGLDDVVALAALDVPPDALGRRRVQFLLGVHGPVAQEDIGDIVDVAVRHPRGMRAADDVYVVGDRQLLHEGDEAGGIFGNLLDRLDRAQRFALERQKLQREEFREGDEIGAVVGGDVDEILDLLLELVDRTDPPHLELHGRNAHPFGQGRIPEARLRLDRFLRQRIAPEHLRRVAAGFEILRHVILQYTENLEALTQLEGQDRIAQLGVLHGAHIVASIGILLGEALIARDAAAEHDALQLVPLAEILAHLVETLTDPQAAEFGIDDHVHAV